MFITLQISHLLNAPNTNFDTLSNIVPRLFPFWGRREMGGGVGGEEGEREREEDSKGSVKKEN